MKLSELKILVDRACDAAIEFGDAPNNITVSIQIDGQEEDSVFSDDIDLIYDNDCQASGCVFVGIANRFRENEE